MLTRKHYEYLAAAVVEIENGAEPARVLATFARERGQNFDEGRVSASIATIPPACGVT